MFTRQHYRAIAGIINATTFWHSDGPKRAERYKVMLPESISNKLADYFAQDNPRFDRDKFLVACGLETQHEDPENHHRR